MRFMLYLSFIGWLWMKMFGKTFDRLKQFRTALRNETHIALILFVMVTALGLLPVAISIAIINTGQEDYVLCNRILFGYLGAALSVFVYQVIKALWEQFQEERFEIFEILKK